jgi:IS30 family transposase
LEKLKEEKLMEYHNLTVVKRSQIDALMSIGLTKKAIAKQLKVAASTKFLAR